MKQRVLLVDDEAAILAVLGPLLEGCGFAVVAAPSAKAAKEALVASTFDAVLTDLRMETESAGYEVTELAASRIPQPAIIIHSGHAAPKGGDFHGAHAFLEKPVPIAILLETIERLLRNRGVRSDRLKKIA